MNVFMLPPPLRSSSSSCVCFPAFQFDALQHANDVSRTPSTPHLQKAVLYMAACPGAKQPILQAGHSRAPDYLQSWASVASSAEGRVVPALSRCFANGRQHEQAMYGSLCPTGKRNCGRPPFRLLPDAPSQPALFVCNIQAFIATPGQLVPNCPPSPLHHEHYYFFTHCSRCIQCIARPRRLVLHVNVDVTLMPQGLDMRTSHHRHTFWMRLGIHMFHITDIDSRHFEPHQLRTTLKGACDIIVSNKSDSTTDDYNSQRP